MIDRTALRALCLVLVIVMVAPLLNGEVSAAGNSKKSKTVATYNLYFGDLHAHTGYSDAYDDSTPWEAYQAAVDAGADFMALTDHVAIWNAYHSFIMNETEWQDTLAAAAAFTSDSFVAMAGYETWLLANCGEINVYNMTTLPPEETLGGRETRLPNFYDWLSAQDGAVGQWNHPLYVSEDFMDYAFYEESRDIGMSVIEVYNEEYYEPSYLKALDAGWHIMPSSNTDTHYSDWMAAHEMRTVLLAESLTPDNLYAAMRANRGYATLDKNLEIYYTLDGAIMGSTLPSTDGTCTASITITDVDGLKDEILLVEIVSNGGYVVKSIPTSGSSVSLSVELDSAIGQYFFVRVTTASPLEMEGAPGVTAWTAPVWVG